MPKDRYFIDQDLKKNSSLEIKDKEAHHIKTLRKKTGEFVEVINGKGFLAKAKIENFDKKSIKIRVIDVFFEKEKKQKLILVQAFIKPNKLEFLLEKTTELGIDEIWLFKSKNSEKLNFSKNRLNRMKFILIAAIKQSGRLYLPKIKIFDSIKDIKNFDSNKNIYFGDVEKKAKRYVDVYKNRTKQSNEDKKTSYFFIGPEMGFFLTEISYLKNNLQAIGVKINSNILRAETAAIAAISIAAHLLKL
ncbi:MAG: Ribosomal RNA small subunit methyltransferase E [Candidatus Anoxychlamydiales bacterium]|nr:Ribosomal RNA small subunit methyltransferase E [Candidatus Anoxychlamydiales bacterium]